MFGGGFFNMGGQAQRQAARGDDIRLDLDVTLEDLYNGAFIEVTRPKGCGHETMTLPGYVRR